MATEGKFCIHCGSEFTKSAKFCELCGEKINRKQKRLQEIPDSPKKIVKKFLITIGVVLLIGILVTVFYTPGYQQDKLLEENLRENYIYSNEEGWVPKKCGIFMGIPEQLQICLNSLYP